MGRFLFLYGVDGVGGVVSDIAQMQLTPISSMASQRGARIPDSLGSIAAINAICNIGVDHRVSRTKRRTDDSNIGTKGE